MALSFAETTFRMHGGLPDRDRRSLGAENGVKARQRHRDDRLTVIRGRGAALNPGVLPRRIAADDQEIHACFVPAVARTRGEEDDVAGSDLDLLTVRPSDQQPCPAFRDPENLVRTAMVMVMGKDAVAPQAAPTIGPEAFFYPCGSIFRNSIA